MKTVLLVEDNDNDILAMELVSQRVGIPHHLKVVKDGQAAIDYLSGSAAYSDRDSHPLPDIVFLDLHIPKRNGHEVLQWAREQSAFKELPIIMLTGSDDRADIEKAHRLGVTSYLNKNFKVQEFGQSMRIILKHWLELNGRWMGE